MPDKDEFQHGAGDIWSTLEILHTATRPEEVAGWLDNNEIPAEMFVSGYPVFIETGIRHFLSLCRYNRDLELEEDYITRRALAQLPPLSKIPHSSETLNLYRNIKQVQTALRGCSSPDPESLISEVAEAIEPLLEVRKGIKQDFEIADVDVPPAQVRRDAVILNLYIAFQQTENNRPFGYGPSNLNSWLGGHFRENSVKGYAATLQYIWSTVLDPEEYVDSGIKNLTQSERYTTRDLSEREQAGIEGADETALSSYRPQIKEDILQPVDARYPDKLSNLSLTAGDLLNWTGGPLRQYITNLISDSSSPSLDDLEPAARVEYGLIWFEQGEWLGGGSFSQAPLIETVIRGLTASYEQFNKMVSLHVTRFNHPVERGNLVSYAILQRVPEMSLGDPSGWLIFNNVAADFEVEGEHRIKHIESLIEEIPDTPVERTTIQVERQQFIDAVADRLSDDYVLQTRANTQMMNAIESGRGVLVELLTAYVLTHRYPDSEIHWSDRRDGEEVDVWVEHDDTVRVIECKTDLAAAGVDKTREQLSRKTSRFRPDWTVKSEVWTWEPPDDTAVEWLESHGIATFCVAESSELNNSDIDDLSALFSEFLPETERHPLMPSPRYSY
jgi:hypothetical protein